MNIVSMWNIAIKYHKTKIVRHGKFTYFPLITIMLSLGLKLKILYNLRGT